VVCTNRSSRADTASLAHSQYSFSFSVFIVRESITNSFQKAINGYLAYNGATTFYASGFPWFEQETVYTKSNNVEVSFMWQER
jgi:hypothetical protein